jgi:hypothetical protein
VLQLRVTANVVPSSLIPSTLMLEAIISPETSAFTRTTRHHAPEDGILHRSSPTFKKDKIVCLFFKLRTTPLRLMAEWGYGVKNF